MQKNKFEELAMSPNLGHYYRHNTGNIHTKSEDSLEIYVGLKLTL